MRTRGFNFPEDAEEMDKMHIEREYIHFVPFGSQAASAYIESAMDTLYPPFEPEIIYSASGKEYFMPALKVLEYYDGRFYSPTFGNLWSEDMELNAVCDDGRIHPSPNSGCACGIYGSVNLDEINRYLYPIDILTISRIRSLYLIEPGVGADVIMCRKGWKASSAFISEIVGETISIDEASSLLSIAWNRKLDIRRVFDENW